MQSVTETRIALLRRGGAIRRFHAFQTLRVQTVADHSWHVAAILDAVMGEAMTANLFRAAMLHDVSELATGDIPHHAKRRDPALRAAAHNASDRFEREHGLLVELTEAEKGALAWADLAEAVLWLLEDAALGNSYAVVNLAGMPDILTEVVTPPTEAARQIADWAAETIRALAEE
jgi:hypothetical protein